MKTALRRHRTSEVSQFLLSVEIIVFLFGDRHLVDRHLGTDNALRSIPSQDASFIARVFCSNKLGLAI